MSTPSEITTTPTTPAHRIFVGNLTQNVESSALETAFAEFGKVLSVRVIKKKFKSNTFGFVDMEELEAANKAIAAINGREFDGKAVNVELARERTIETKPKRVSTKKPRATKTASTTGENATESTESSPTLNGKTTTPRRRNNKRNSTKSTTTTGDAPSTAATTTATATVAPVKTTKPKREKKPVASTADRQQSTTTLFVRNIPYSFDDAKLLETFKDCSPKSAHVIVNKHTNRSKGFGFVEFDDVTNQLKGLSLNKHNVENRELSVKVALVPEHNTNNATTPDTTTVTA